MPAAHRDRQRLAGQRARVDDGLRARRRAVDGDDLAGAHDHDVARPDLVDRDLLDAVADPQLRDLGGALRPARSARAARAARRSSSSACAAGEHQPDHRAGELLAERERADHRDQRDRVDPDVTIDDHRARDLERELGSQHQHGREPHVTRRSALAREVQHAADQNRQRSHQCEDPRAVRKQPAPDATSASRTLAPASLSLSHHRRHPFRGHTPLSANVCLREYRAPADLSP